jgi:histone acetyltransferase (RNA polymerase elongator complex component)
LRPLVVPFFLSHLGCPHRCVFCDQEKIAGAPGILPDAAEMLAQIEHYRAGAAHRTLEVAFYGGSFTCLPHDDQHYLLATLQPLLSSGEISSLRLSTRPDAIDAETVAFLKGMGVRTVELGVQSMNDEVLRLAGRGHSSRDAELALRLLQVAGIEVGVQLMPGLPGDSEETSLASLEQVLRLKPDFLRIYPTVVVEGTELAARYRAGSYAPLTLERAVSLCARMLLAARRAAVPVIRMGLQATPKLEAPGVLLAGPYHPAFGQLVSSELCCQLMARLLAGVNRGSRVSFVCASGRTSDLVGQGRRNLERLAAHFDVLLAPVREDAALDRDCIVLQCDGQRLSGTLSDLA